MQICTKKEVEKLIDKAKGQMEELGVDFPTEKFYQLIKKAAYPTFKNHSIDKTMSDFFS